MRDYKTYRNEYEKAQRDFQSQISDRETKAFEYGAIVVRNAVLISGGGLLAIPTIVGLASNVPINMADAAIAGLAFALALIVSILGSYVIHINWTLHAASWVKHWEDRQEFLRKAYLEDASEDELRVEPQSYFQRSILITFWVPHLLALVYMVLISYGFPRLYSALGVSA